MNSTTPDDVGSGTPEPAKREDRIHRRNARALLIIVIGTAVWMTIVHLLLFPAQGILGISGIGVTAVALMFLNRWWLTPSSPAYPRSIVLRNALVAAILGTSFVLLFGAMGQM